MTRSRLVVSLALLLVMILLVVVTWKDQPDPSRSSVERAAETPRSAAAPAETGDAGRRAATVPPLEAGPPSPEPTTPAWADCFSLESDQAFTDCLKSSIQDSIPVQDLADFLCAHRGQSGRNSLLFALSLLHLSPSAAWDYIDEVNAECDYYIGSGFSQTMIRTASELAPHWYLDFGVSLSPDHLFRETRTDVGMLVARIVAETNPAAKDILDRGARGEWGGTDEQIVRCIVSATTLRKTPEERYEFITSLLQAPTFPDTPFAGGSTGLMLLRERNWPNRDWAPPIARAIAILDDPRYRKNLAANIFHSFGEDTPPPSIPDEEWSRIWRKVVEIRAED